MKRVIQLLRVSTEGQAADDRNGLAAQREACARLVQQHRLTVGHTVELVDVSGAAIMATAEMQELIRLLQTGQYHGLVVREFSRVLRPTNYDYYLFGVMAETRATLYSESGVIEPWTPTGRMMVAMHGVIAANELDTIRGRMMAGKETMRRAGRWAAGNHCLPIGVDYNRATGTFSYNERAGQVRRVFKGFLAGNTNYDALSRLLGMTRGTARNVLTNPIYTGWLVYDKRRDERRKYKTDRADGRHTDRPKVARPESEIIRVKVIEEPLISERDFQHVQAIVRRKAETNLHQRQKVGLFTFNGFLWCAKCGARLHTFRNQFNRFYYICSNKKRKGEGGENLCQYTSYMNRDRLEAQLDTLMETVLGNPARLRRIVAAYRARVKANSNGADVRRLEREMERLQAKRLRVAENYDDGVYTKAERDTKLKVIDTQLRTAENEMARVRPTDAPAVDAKELAAVLEPLAGWSVLNRGEKRRLLAALQPRFEIADYRIRGVLLGGSVNINTNSRSKRAPFALRVRPCR